MHAAVAGKEAGATVMVGAMDVCHVKEGTSGAEKSKCRVVGAASLQAVKTSAVANE
jgi:hypothetical protein